MATPALTGVAALLLAAAQPTADEVIARSVEAQGGLQRIRAVQSVRMTGRISAGAMDMPMTLEFKRPALFRAEQTFQGRQAVQGYDGRQAWFIPPGQRRAEALPADAAKQLATQADFEGPLVDYKAKGSQAELVGKEKLADGEAWRIKLTDRAGQVAFCLVDARSWLLVRVDATRTVQGRTVEGQAALSDYRESGGWKWPMLIENSAKGMPERQTITFERIEVNPALDDARFRMPASSPETRRPNP